MSPGPGEFGLVTPAIVPVRAEPSHRAERVTDWILGEAVEVIAVEEGWVRGRGPDGYEGWAPSGRLRGCDSEAAEDWVRRATLYSTGTACDEPDGLARLPWGARVAPAEDGTIALPDGRRVRPATPGRIVDLAYLREHPRVRPEDPASITRAALDWIDVPYVWGGRTELGVDCSGFVQALFARYGVLLPRDSHAQLDAGPPAPMGERGLSEPQVEPGDLLFFAPEGRGVTHVALVLEDLRVVHAASTNGRVAVEDLAEDAPLARRLATSIAGCTRPLSGRPDG